jgi:hypothetical protein
MGQIDVMSPLKHCHWRRYLAAILAAHCRSPCVRPPVWGSFLRLSLARESPLPATGRLVALRSNDAAKKSKREAL